jgi:hypothetical protein
VGHSVYAQTASYFLVTVRVTVRLPTRQKESPRQRKSLRGRHLAMGLGGVEPPTSRLSGVPRPKLWLTACTRKRPKPRRAAQPAPKLKRNRAGCTPQLTPLIDTSAGHHPFSQDAGRRGSQTAVLPNEGEELGRVPQLRQCHRRCLDSDAMQPVAAASDCRRRKRGDRTASAAVNARLVIVLR